MYKGCGMLRKRKLCSEVNCMKYHFIGDVVSENGVYFIKIPFNVWEVCTGQGSFPVSVTAQGNEFTCDLVPLGKGLYQIPLTKELADALPKQCDVTFRVIEHVANVSGSSPYSLENPIRKVDSMKLITQPNDGLCGQTCVAMLAGITFEETINILHCSEWQATIAKIIGLIRVSTCVCRMRSTGAAFFCR